MVDFGDYVNQSYPTFGSYQEFERRLQKKTSTQSEMVEVMKYKWPDYMVYRSTMIYVFEKKWDVQRYIEH